MKSALTSSGGGTGERFFAEARNETVERRQAARDPLYALQISDGAHLGYRSDFFWVGLDATLRHDEPQKHTLRNAKDAFLRIELDVFCPEAFERNVKVVYQIVGLFGLDNDVIDVSLDGWSDVFPKNVLHASLVRCPCVSESEGHRNVAIHAEWGNE
jgi:hypothetical protein